MSYDDAMTGVEDAPIPASSIVVGHDGSDGADCALATTMKLAEQLQAAVVIVRAWSISTAPRPLSWEFGYMPPFNEYAEAVRSQLVSDTRAIVEQSSRVDVEYRALHSEAAKSLIETSRDARMLVVGCRGLGGFAEMVLGSVSHRCVGHAFCPVLVVRPRARDSLSADRSQQELIAS